MSADEHRRLAEERRGKTYFGHALNAEPEMGGRFARVSRTTVVAAAPVSYPAQPTGSPWANEPIGAEALIDGRGEGTVLGYEIDRPDAAPVEPIHEVGVSRPTKFVRRF